MAAFTTVTTCFDSDSFWTHFHRFFCDFFSQLFRAVMADSDSYGDVALGEIIDDFIRVRALGLCVDDQSDVSESDVHTSDFSDWDSSESIGVFARKKNCKCAQYFMILTWSLSGQ